jgi:CelD/BcsL family acetyltransferase involved in cellulose biosynthesis
MAEHAKIQIETVEPTQLSSTDVAAWRALQIATGRTSPFLSPHWAQACAAVPGPDQRGARVAILRRDGEAVGFFAARAHGLTAGPVGAPMCDYQGLVARQDSRIEPCALVRALGVRRFDFDSMPFDQADFQLCHRGLSTSYVIDLSGGFNAYVAARRSAGTDIFQDTAKKRRKLEREQGEVVFAPSRDAAAFDQLLAWKRAQYRMTRQPDIFEAGWTRDLLQTLFERPAQPYASTPEASDFGGALFTLHVGGRLAAGHFALRQGPVLHAWFIAHDEAFSKYSPGVILIADILRWGAGQGVVEVDLGPGDYRFKQSLANLARPVAHGYVGLPGAATALRAAAYRLRRAAEALPLGPMSALPGKAMRRLDLIRSLA